MLTKEDKKKLKTLQKILRYKFRRIIHLQQALTHSSFVNENPEKKLNSNETLEFLGDAVLGLVISEYLYKKFPDFSEGKMSILRSSLVNESALADIAFSLDLGEYIFLGKGEDREKSKSRPSLLSNTLEALIGAMFLDGNLKQAKKFIEKIYQKKMIEIPESGLAGSYKNRLQHHTQSKLGCMPQYKITSEYGPPHKRIYKIEVHFNDKTYGKGSGTSKKKAQQEAAKNTLIILGLEKNES